jgi:phosphosulfolactate synthase
MVNTWEEVVQYPLGTRSSKPREKGISMVIDKGLGLRELRDLLEVSGKYLDFLKLGFGTSVLYIESLLKAKIELCEEYQIIIYPGGTLMEAALLQGRFEKYLELARELGFKAVEISDGTIFMDEQTRRYCIRRAVSEGFTVLTELGKKDPNEEEPVDHLIAKGQEDLANGAWKVIMEARESGKGIGIYDESGAIRKDKMEELLENIGDINNIIWEAPLKSQQLELIRRFGTDVNMGNIQPGDLLALETLRTGLRGDTLRLVNNTPNTQANAG